MKKLYLLVIFILTYNTLYGQNQNIEECIKKVKSINSICLKKVLIGLNEEDVYGLYSDYKFDDSLMTNALYLDSLNQIRKHIYYSYAETCETTIICYYDTGGELIFMIYNDYYWDVNNPPSNTEVPTRLTGYIFADKNATIKQEWKLIKKYDYNTLIKYYNSLDQQSISVKARRINLKKYETTDELLSSYQLKSSNLGIAQIFKVVIFDGKKGVSFVNRNDVLVRTGPNKEYPVNEELNRVDLGKVLLIESTNKEIKKDKIDRCGWSEIIDPFTGVKGYIYGAFLEPVERVIEE